MITAATLTGSSSGAVDLSTASNAIGALGAFAPGGDFNLNNGATALQFTGAFAGAGDTLTLNAGADQPDRGRGDHGGDAHRLVVRRGRPEHRQQCHRRTGRIHPGRRFQAERWRDARCSSAAPSPAPATP